MPLTVAVRRFEKEERCIRNSLERDVLITVLMFRKLVLLLRSL